MLKLYGVDAPATKDFGKRCLLARRLVERGIRLSKRLAKYGSERLTFLWHEDLPSDNNAGERAIRPAVMIRKNSCCNHSDRGALTQSVLMSVLRTLRVRDLQPLDTILIALADYAKTGVIPPLPGKNALTGLPLRSAVARLPI